MYNLQQRVATESRLNRFIMQNLLLSFLFFSLNKSSLALQSFPSARFRGVIALKIALKSAASQE